MKIFDIFTDESNLNLFDLLSKNPIVSLEDLSDSSKERRKTLSRALSAGREYAKDDHFYNNIRKCEKKKGLSFRSCYMFDVNDKALRSAYCLSDKSWKSVSSFFLSFISDKLAGAFIYDDFLMLVFDRERTEDYYLIRDIVYGHSINNVEIPLEAFSVVLDSVLFIGRRSNYVR